jgi:hypothetical protein
MNSKHKEDGGKDREHTEDFGVGHTLSTLSRFHAIYTQSKTSGGITTRPTRHARHTSACMPRRSYRHAPTSSTSHNNRTGSVMADSNNLGTEN